MCKINAARKRAIIYAVILLAKHIRRRMIIIAKMCRINVGLLQSKTVGYYKLDVHAKYAQEHSIIVGKINLNTYMIFLAKNV